MGSPLTAAQSSTCKAHSRAGWLDQRPKMALVCLDLDSSRVGSQLLITWLITLLRCLRLILKEWINARFYAVQRLDSVQAPLSHPVFRNRQTIQYEAILSSPLVLSCASLCSTAAAQHNVYLERLPCSTACHLMAPLDDYRYYRISAAEYPGACQLSVAFHRLSVSHRIRLISYWFP